MTTKFKKFASKLGGLSTVAMLAVAALLSVVLGCGGASTSPQTLAENSSIVMDLTGPTSTTVTKTTTYATTGAPATPVITTSETSTLNDPALPAAGTPDDPIVVQSGDPGIIAGTTNGTTRRVTSYTVMNAAGGDTVAFTIINRSGHRLVAASWSDNTSVTPQTQVFTPSIGTNGKIGVLAKFNRFGTTNAAIIITGDGTGGSRGFTLTRTAPSSTTLRATTSGITVVGLEVIYE